MRTAELALVLLCVSLASVGQVLLRAAAVVAKQAPEPGLAAWFNMTSVLAVAVYVGAMVLWLWVLGRVPLSSAFAFFGLTFLFVPLLAHRFLGDPVTPYTWIGAVIIFAGILVSTRTPAS